MRQQLIKHKEVILAHKEAQVKSAIAMTVNFPADRKVTREPNMAMLLADLKLAAKNMAWLNNDSESMIALA